MRLKGVSVFYTLQDIFEHLRTTPASEAGLLAASVVFGAVTGDAYALGSQLGWIAKDSNGRVHPTDAGLGVHPRGARSIQLRHQLRAFINQTKPSWAALLARGRKETAALVPAEIRQCLLDAGLLIDVDSETVRWWDSLALAARSDNQENLLTVGRFGERLSLEFEQARVGRRPLWQALESNAAGYDLLSWASTDAQERLPIEVKTSTLSMDSALFYVTRNEWETARMARRFQFHLWLIGSGEQRLWIAEVADVEEHIPTDLGLGRWEMAAVPFAVWTSLAPLHRVQTEFRFQALPC
jgi:hypothetical protein